ncbi:MAG: sugar transferase, partial [Terriglobales bacterium]
MMLQLQVINWGEPRRMLKTDIETGVIPARTASRCGHERWQVLMHPAVAALLFLFGDMIGVIMTYELASLAVRHWLKIPAQAMNPSGYVLFFPLFLACVLWAMTGYSHAALRRPEKELAVCVKALTMAFLVLLAANFLVFRYHVFSRYLIVVWYVFAVVAVLCCRFGLRAVYAALWRAGKARQRAVLIGRPERLIEYRELLAVQRHHSCEILGVLTDAPGSLGEEAPVLGLLDDWEGVALRARAQLIIVDQPSTPHDFVLHILRRCRELRLQVELFTNVLNGSAASFEFDEFSRCFRFIAEPRWRRQLQWVCKRILDRVVGLIGSLIAILLMLPLAILLKLEDGGALFHRRQFVGCDGQTHYYLKFRTMVVDADQLLSDNDGLRERFAKNHKLKDDPRVLR